jgi:ribulose-5-phosphate 4-epimerase/fuculose-1-phosphate aldolase
VVSLGPSIPTVPFAPPGPAAAEALARFAADHDAVLAANHGAFAWGADLDTAYLRLELVEHLARIATLAQATGGVTYLPDSAIPSLLQSRARDGLGAAADRAADLPGKPVVACAPAPHSPTPTIAPGRRADVAALVREEILRALRER